jgi:Kef-type K+ transport system membrane component KefB
LGGRAAILVVVDQRIDLPGRLNKPLAHAFFLSVLILLPALAAAQTHDTRAAHVDPVTPVVLALAVILAAAKLAGHLAARIGQPAVLGELLAGVVLGNVDLMGIDWFHRIEADPGVDILARLGVVILLFEVGLESTVRDMLKVGLPSVLVAVLGVVAPFADVGLVLGKAVAFLFGALLLGVWLSPRLFNMAARLSGRGVLLATALMFCFGLAYLASVVGLAPIVGAYAAGLILEDVHVRPFAHRGEQQLEHLVHPISTFLVPVFFVIMGMRVDLSAFARTDVLGLAAVLTLAAIVGKQACSLGAIDQSLDRLSIGIGMIPRGEVGLIFANIGLSLSLAGQPIVDEGIFAAVVIMIIVTTMATPPLLKWSLARR